MKVSLLSRGWLTAIFLLALFLGGCRTTSILTVDLSSPGPEEISDQIQSLLLINRAVDRRFTDDPSDTIQLRFFEKRFSLDTTIYDLQASDTLLQTLGTLLFESGRFDIVIPVERFPMKDTLHPFSEPMSWNEVEKLTSDFRTDAILSLDYHKTDISTSYERESLRDAESGAFFNIYEPTMQISTTAQFRIYDPSRRDEVPSHFLIDTLYWRSADYSLTEVLRRFTYVKQGLTESGIVAALTLSEKIAPHWVTSKRVVFLTGNKALRNAAPLVAEHRWDEALALWEAAAAQTRAKGLLSKLQFNMALAMEMQGDLNEAIRRGVQSYNTMFRKVTYDYLETLKKRKELLNKKDDQE